MKSCYRDLGFEFDGLAAGGILPLRAATSIRSSLFISRSQN